MSWLLLPTCVARSSIISEDEGTRVLDQTLADRGRPVVVASVRGSAARGPAIRQRVELLLAEVVLAAAILYAVHSKWRLRHSRPCLYHYQLLLALDCIGAPSPE